tara:strand:- start:1207 stop:1911 length:705 start_codon:yes stop_codon:yes gene_type:complete
MNDLERIIVEELQDYLNEVGLCHNTKGHFTKCRKGSVYSLTKKAAEKNKIDKSFVGRGVVSSKKKRQPAKIKSKAGMNSGPETSAGRKLLDGDDIPPKYRVLGYKDEYYKEELSPETGLPIKSRYKPSWPSSKKRKRQDRIGKPDRTKDGWTHGHKELIDLARLKGLYENVRVSLYDVANVVLTSLNEIKMNESTNEHNRCRKLGYVTTGEAQQQILKALNNFALAQDGKLFTK